MKYRVYLSTKITPKKLTKLKDKECGILVIEPDDYTKKEVTALKATGYIVLAYLSVGTIEKERSWWSKYKIYALKKLEDWPDENYADLTKKDWRLFLYDRGKQLRKKGFDGLWLDNIDVYEYYPSADMKKALFKILNELVYVVFDDCYIMINGGSKFLEEEHLALRGYIDGYTQEEVFSRITSYKGSGKFGKQKKKESDYYKKIIDQCMLDGFCCYLLEYTKDEKLKDAIKDYKKAGNCDGYYISEDVNL